MSSFNDNSLENLLLPKNLFSLKKGMNNERKRSLELTRGSNDSNKIKEKPNLNERSFKKIKKIKDIMQNSSKNIDNKDTASNQNSYFPICLSFMTNSKNYPNSISDKFKIRNRYTKFGNKTIEDFSSFYNNSMLNNINSVQNQHYKKINLNINFENAKESKMKIPKLNINNSPKNKKFKLFEPNGNKSVKIKNYNYFIGSVDKTINIYNPKKRIKQKPKPFLESKVYDEAEGDDQLRQKINEINRFVSMNLSKKKLQIYLKNKINNSMLDTNTENKELTRKDSIKSVQNINKDISDSKKDRNLILMKKMNNGSTKILSPETTIKKEKSSKAIIIIKAKDEEDQRTNSKKDKDKKNKNKKIDDKNESDKKETNEENIKDNKEKKEFKEKKGKKEKKEKESKENKDNKESKEKKDNKEIKEKEKVNELKKSKRKKNITGKNNSKSKTNFVKISERSPKKQKIKFNNLILKKENKPLNNDINMAFLNEIKEDNDTNKKHKLLDKEIKANKTAKLLLKKSIIDRLITKNKERLKTNNFTFNLNRAIHSEKISISEIYRTKMKSNRKIYLELKKLSILYNLLYGYIESVYKCSLDNNMINYVRLHVEFSSIYLPVMNLGQEKSILITDKLFSFKNKKNNTSNNILQMGKSKFVEAKKYQKGVQSIALNFITKELIYYNILAEDFNYLKEENSENIESNSTHRKSSVSTKKLPNFSTHYNSKKKVVSYFRRNSVQRRLIYPSTLSLLEKKKFFDVSKKGIENRLKYSLNSNLILYKLSKNYSLNVSDIKLKDRLNKQYLNRAISLIHDHKIKKEYSNHQLDYFELLRKITGRQNIEMILRAFIQEGETLLFTEYFNNNYRRIDMNAKDEDGNTFLILSIKQGLNFITKTLIEKGVDLNIQNNEGNSALHYALSGKNFEVADLLKKYGAKEDCYNSMGYTPWDCVGKSIDIKND